MQGPSPISFTEPGRERRYLELLVRAGEILSGALDWHQTIASVCEAAVETVADICLLDLTESGPIELVGAAHSDSKLSKELRSAGGFLHQNTRSAIHPVLTVIATAQPVLVPVVDEQYLRSHSTSAEHEAFMRRMHYCSLMIVPVISKTEGVVGALTLVRTDSTKEPYGEQDLRFAQDLARRCATAIAKARLYERTVQIATMYQRASLPERLPSIDGISLDAFYEASSEELLVGGDWYDAFELSDGRIAITVGDVLGHGIEAATWMSRLRNGLRAALFADPDAARALEIADEMLRKEFREEFTTALVALLDPARQTFSCASAGHPGPLVWDGSGDVIDPFRERGLPLGLRTLGPVAKTAQVMATQPGSFAVFFTDGLLEWNRNIGEAWHRLQCAVERKDVREALHPANAIRQCVIGDNPHGDDIAILTVRWDKVRRRLGAKV